MKKYAVYSEVGKPVNNKLLDWFLSMFYRKYVIFKRVSGTEYIIEYSRSKFMENEDPSLKLFFSDKFTTWQGRVWRVYESGGMYGCGSVCIKSTMFPRQKMKEFLKQEVDRMTRHIGCAMYYTATNQNE